MPVSHGAKQLNTFLQLMCGHHVLQDSQFGAAPPCRSACLWFFPLTKHGVMSRGMPCACRFDQLTAVAELMHVPHGAKGLQFSMCKLLQYISDVLAASRH